MKTEIARQKYYLNTQIMSSKKNSIFDIWTEFLKKILGNL